MKRIIGLVLTFVFILSIPVSLAEDDIARRYQQAQMLMEIGDYLTAAQILESLGDYKDSQEMLKQAHEHIASPKPTSTPSRKPTPTPATMPTPVPQLTGSIITFGRYEQDNNKSNGKEPIEWRVLDCDWARGQILLLSEYGLDARTYDPGNHYPTWEYSGIREWLHKEFLFDAFSDEDLKFILMRDTHTPDYKQISGGEDTSDAVFLLSREEIISYLPTNEERKIIPTAYAKANGAHQSRSQKLNGSGTGFYWLRSPGDDKKKACNVNTDGSVGNDDSSVHDRTACVRPAVWVDASLVFSDSMW